MTSMSQNRAEKPSRRCDGVMNMNEIMTRELSEFYRESQKLLSSDSGESSGRNSVCNDIDYKNSVEDIQAVRMSHQKSRDEIAEKLSQLKIESDKNLKSDSGTVDDMTSEDNLKSDSIIAGKSPADVHHTSVQSLPDYGYSLVLAGRLDSKDDSSAYPDDQSLLNIAINESVETDSADCENNADLSNFEDSLDVQTEGISTSSIYGKDSLEAENYCCRNKSINEKRGDFLSDNNENVDPNSLENNHGGRPRIKSVEIVKFPFNLVKQTTTKITGIPENETYTTKNISNSSNYLDINRFHSLMSDTEQIITNGVKTPNFKNMFIEDYSKSTPQVKLHANAFGTDLMTDIANLSTLGEGDIELDGKSVGIDNLRDEIFERFSQQFTEEPMKFTEQLLAIVEQSVSGNFRSENPNVSGVSLDRLTGEFRKICRYKRIEDESMPSQLFEISNYPNLEGTHHDVTKEAPASSPFHNFTKFGRGKKVYPRTPRNIFNSSNNSTYCNTQNCANALHRVKNNNLYSPKIYSPGGEANSTANFEFWENVCFEMSPTKQSNSKSLNVDKSGVSSHEDFIRKSYQQMAALDQSITIVAEVDKKSESDINEIANVYPRDRQSHCNYIKQKLTENTRDIKREQNHDEIDQILAARLVEKRRKCFEEAAKAFESKKNASENGNRKSVDKVSENINKNKSLKERDNEARFMSTLAACADYFDHFKSFQNHRASLACIMECSEYSESTKESENDSSPIKCMNTSTIYPRISVEIPKESEKNLIPENRNLVVKPCLYVSETLETPKRRSPRGHGRRSPIRRLSPAARPVSVISKRIKSPVSSAKRRSNHLAVRQGTIASAPRSPSLTPQDCVSKKPNRLMESASRCPSSNKLKSTQNNSPSLMDVTNTKKRFEVPKFIFTNSSPSSESPKISCRLKKAIENTDYNCQKQLEFAKTDTPESGIKNKYFYTPGKSPLYNKVKSRKKFFETPRGCKPLQNKILTPSPGSYRVNYNTVQSPVGMYIRGTDPNLIKNVKGKTNDRMLTPRAKTPKSKCPSPILARSPRLSPTSAETARLKFQLTPSKRQMKMQSKESDFLNMALCESDPSSEIGSENTTPHSPFPKIFYNPAQCVKMVNDNQPQRNARVTASGKEEQIIYRHDGRLKSAKESKVQNSPIEGDSTKDNLSHDSGDISLLHQRPMMKSNYLLRK